MTTSIFNETLPTTTKGTLRASTVAALLRRRSDLECSLTWSFVGFSEDGIARVERRLATTEVIADYLTRPLTLAIYKAERFGCEVLVISTAAHTAFVHDAAYRSRRTLVDALACFAIPRDRQTPLQIGERLMRWGALHESIVTMLDIGIVSDAVFTASLSLIEAAGVDARQLAAVVAAERGAKGRRA